MLKSLTDRCGIRQCVGRRRSCVVRGCVSTAGTNSCRCWCTWNDCVRTCRSTLSYVKDSTSVWWRTSW